MKDIELKSKFTEEELEKAIINLFEEEGYLVGLLDEDNNSVKNLFSRIVP